MINSCHETDDLGADEERFEQQKPRPGNAPRLLRARIRTTASPALNEHLHALWRRTSNAEITPSELASMFMKWSRTKKIATRIEEGCMARTSYERITILSAYKYALGLGNSPNVSAYRDALIDAMTEYFDHFGDELLSWNDLAQATKTHIWCAMWKLKGFRYA